MGGAWGGRWPTLGRARPACGIEVTEQALRAVACDVHGNLLATAETAVEASGDDAWLEAFRRLRATAPNLGRDVVCCGPPAWTDALPLRLPQAGDLEPLLIERARQHLSYAVEDAVLDYVGPELRADGTRRALLFALPRQRVLQLLEAAASGGFHILAVESPGIALHRLLRRGGRLDGRRSLLVHLDRAHTLFLVLDAENLHVERALGWGMARLESAVEEQLEVPAQVARHLLQGGDDALGSQGDAGDVRGALREIVLPVLRELAVEVERVLGYCRAEFRDAGVERLLLSAGAAQAWSVRESLLRSAPDFEDAWPHPAPGSGEDAAFAVARGLALRCAEHPCGP